MSNRAKRRERRLKIVQSNQVEIPKDNKSTTREYWYKKPVGKIVIGVATTLIAAAIIGFFNHFTSSSESQKTRSTIILKDNQVNNAGGTAYKVNVPPDTQILLDNNKATNVKKGIEINIPTKK